MTATAHPTLVAPPVLEGTCPSRACRIVDEVNDAHQIRVHREGGLSTQRRCPCSGWKARDVHERKHFFVEGVRYL